MNHIFRLCILLLGLQSNLFCSNSLSAKPVVLNILDVYPLALTLNQTGTNQPTFSIASNINWTISSNMNWLTVNKSGGSGNAVITVNATPNSFSTSRTGTLTVSGPNASSKKVIITQYGVAPSLVVSPTDVTIAAALNSTTTFSINSNTAWNLFSNQSWLQTSVQSGNGNAVITLNSLKNPFSTTRKAIITCTASAVPDRTISVTQEAALPELTASPKFLSIASLPNSQINFDVFCNTSWSASSDQNWLRVNQAVGYGNGSITLIADQNPAVVQRSALVRLNAPGTADEYVTVVQEGAPPYFDLAPVDLTISELASNNRQIIVSSNVGWTVTSDKNWLDVSRLSGLGSGTVTLLASENTTISDRVATLTFFPFGKPTKTVKVSQLPGKAILKASPENLGIAAAEGSTSVINVGSNTRWDLFIDQSWLEADRYSGIGNAIVVLRANENQAVTTRTATVTVVAGGLPYQVVKVTQNAAGIKLIAAPDIVSVPSPASASRYFDISSNTAWTATTDQSWLRLSEYNGNGNTRMYLLADENILSRGRTAYIDLSAPGSGNVRITVVQDAALAALVVNPKKVTLLPSAGHSKKIYIESNSDWVAECPDNWLTINKISGFGSDTLMVTADGNLKINNRSTKLTLSSKGAAAQFVDVEQLAAPARAKATPDNVQLAAVAGSSQSVFVESNTNWTIASNETWLSFDKIAGLENDNILFTATANPTDKARFAIASLSASGIADLTIGVTQDAASSYISVSPDSLLIGSIDQSTETINIISNADWIINSNQSWIAPEIFNGTGNKSVLLTATGNPSASRRYTTLSIKVGGLAAKTIYITQEAAPVYLSASPQRLSLSAAPGNKETLQILTNTTWSLTTDQKWLKTNYNSGSGNSTLTITADENTLPSSRTALIAIQGKSAPPAFVIVEQLSNVSSTAQTSGKKNMDIFPNPVQDVMYCHLKNEMYANLTADILDLRGIQIVSFAINDTMTAINVSGLTPGIYLLQVTDIYTGSIKKHRFVKL